MARVRGQGIFKGWLLHWARDGPDKTLLVFKRNNGRHGQRFTEVFLRQGRPELRQEVSILSRFKLLFLGLLLALELLKLRFAG
jgi:hypothetical protein